MKLYTHSIFLFLLIAPHQSWGMFDFFRSAPTELPKTADELRVQYGIEGRKSFYQTESEPYIISQMIKIREEQIKTAQSPSSSLDLQKVILQARAEIAELKELAKDTELNQLASKKNLTPAEVNNLKKKQKELIQKLNLESENINQTVNKIINETQQEIQATQESQGFVTVLPKEQRATMGNLQTRLAQAQDLKQILTILKKPVIKEQPAIQAPTASGLQFQPTVQTTAEKTTVSASKVTPPASPEKTQELAQKISATETAVPEGLWKFDLTFSDKAKQDLLSQGEKGLNELKNRLATFALQGWDMFLLNNPTEAQQYSKQAKDLAQQLKNSSATQELQQQFQAIEDFFNSVSTVGPNYLTKDEETIKLADQELIKSINQLQDVLGLPKPPF